MHRCGVKSFRAKSGLGYPFLCHIGDFIGELPFYNLENCKKEIRVMSLWCGKIDNPVIFDVGANLGFMATQLAQALRSQNPRIIAFEPVPSTFAKLTQSVRCLKLEKYVSAVCCAVSDSCGLCSIAYDPAQSLFAQIRDDKFNKRAGAQVTFASCLTLDGAAESLGLKPSLVKIDVEGFEGHVLRGAKRLLSSCQPPAVCFEWNPITMKEVGAPPSTVVQELCNYRTFYIDDFEGQKMPFGEEVRDLSKIGWISNIFAVPYNSNALNHWARCCDEIAATSRTAREVSYH